MMAAIYSTVPWPPVRRRFLPTLSSSPGRSRPCPPRRRQVIGATALALAAAVVSGTAAAQEATDGPETEDLDRLDHEVYDEWNRLHQTGLSADGQWLTYRTFPGHGDGALHVEAVEGDERYELERGRSAAFTRDAAFVVFRIDPAQEAQDEAEEDPDLEEPQDSLGVLNLETGQVETQERLRSFTVPEESEDWILVHRLEPPEEEEPEEKDEPEEEEEPEADEDEAPDRERDTGTDLHYMNLDTGEERVFEDVTAYAVHEDGDRFAYIAQSEDGEGDGVYVVHADEAEPRAVLQGKARFARLTLDDAGEQVAFLSDLDRWETDEEDPDPSLYHAGLEDGEVRVVAEPGTAQLPSGWRPSDEGSVSFSEDGSRLFFGTQPPDRPEPDEEDELLQNVEVDVWNWQDDYLMTHQLQQRDQELSRTYEAVAFLEEDDRLVQLEDESLLSVSTGSGGDADVALGQDDQPYRQLVSWDTGHSDFYLVDVATGEREKIIERLRGGASLSPDGRYVYWWDHDEQDWFALDVEVGEPVNVSEEVPVPVHNVLHDRTSPPGSAGFAGWLEDDEAMVIYDRYDLWLLDAEGEREPENVTAGYGREHDLRLRLVRLNWDEPAIPADEELLLSAFNFETKADGYYRTRFDRFRKPERVVMEDVSFGSLSKAEDADVLSFTKSTFEMFPDVWVSDEDFEDQRRVSEANPQQADYVWGSAELVNWTSADGEELQGILYKPDDFDPDEEWPMMVYFYERSSNGLHSHHVPSTGTSINRSFYVSRGYVLFVPDIPYKEGYPGESAKNAVIPGVQSIVDRGFIDRERVGVQGHSWGGYQIAYMITRSNIFAAAEAGAPVTNMTSAYGGIRWSSGLVRQMQYESGQSRIGASLWEAQHRYIENSPLFKAYRVETPLLILHNDEDGAVPWEEGIQFFTALRRLGKPSWLVNYNNQGHGVSGRYSQLDWTKRMQQFFDHYLQGAPPPVWMQEGVPAVDKGRTLGLDLMEEVVEENDGGESPER